MRQAVGDLVVDFDWQPVAGTEKCYGKGGCHFAAVLPGAFPSLHVVRSNLPCTANINQDTVWQGTINGVGIECGEVPAGTAVDLTVQYSVDHNDVRYGAVIPSDPSRCGWDPCDEIGGGSTIKTLPGSVVTWKEGLN
jgi:hypothetical protein